ncbi:hypothetical protein [Streptomyces xinghaiensis]|uniref:hypothetical protein n=1 Tax=Streptomyces xinghaiensis TaxID=1038928 RepID=UPI00343237C4
MRGFVAAAALMAVLALSSCGAGEARENGEGAGERPHCRKILGDAGMSWLEASVEGDLHLGGTDDLARVRSLFYSQLRSWDPESTDFSFADAHVCGVGVEGERPGEGFDIRYTRSVFPFGNIAGRDDEMITTSVNSDVVLVHGEAVGEPPTYRVYFKCQIPGAPTEQEEEVPVMGEMVDTLTGESSVRVRMTHLLHSAQVMARTFDCENDPVIPSEPPASVK